LVFCIVSVFCSVFLFSVSFVLFSVLSYYRILTQFLVYISVFLIISQSSFSCSFSVSVLIFYLSISSVLYVFSVLSYYRILTLSLHFYAFNFSLWCLSRHFFSVYFFSFVSFLSLELLSDFNSVLCPFTFMHSISACDVSVVISSLSFSSVLLVFSVLSYYLIFT
jgi:hypothetical protein